MEELWNRSRSRALVKAPRAATTPRSSPTFEPLYAARLRSSSRPVRQRLGGVVKHASARSPPSTLPGLLPYSPSQPATRLPPAYLLLHAAHPILSQLPPIPCGVSGWALLLSCSYPAPTTPTSPLLDLDVSPCLATVLSHTQHKQHRTLPRHRQPSGRRQSPAIAFHRPHRPSTRPYGAIGPLPSRPSLHISACLRPFQSPTDA